MASLDQIKAVLNSLFRKGKATVAWLLNYCCKHVEVFAIIILIAIATAKFYVHPQSQTFEQVVQNGELRVLITDEPDSLYVFNKQHFGFEYELLEQFAEQMNVNLSLEVVPYGELFALLESGAGDIAIGGILDSPFVRRVATPTLAWYQAETIVVYRRGTKRPLDIEDFNNEKVLMSSRYYNIEELTALNLVDDHRSEYELLSAVNRGEESYVLSTNYRAGNAKHYLPHLNRSFILPDKLDVVWVLPKRHDTVLLNALNVFLQNALDDNKPEQLAESYFSLPKRLSVYDGLVVHEKINDVLPNFEYKFRTSARKVSIDWHLLGAIAYQESQWSNDARSPTGVRGIMQLTTDTASFLGIDDRLDMNKSIDAAAGYLINLKSRLPDDIKEPERTWFAVGSYNMGLRHIINAYNKAKKKGLDHTQWSTVSGLLPRLYGKPFSRGKQAQNYVERVQIFTDILRFYDLHQRNDDPFIKTFDQI